MPYRKTPLVEGEIYHIVTKSIAEFTIFRCEKDFQRMLDTVVFYMKDNLPCKFSVFLEKKEKFKGDLYEYKPSEKKVKIIAHCLMPTHLHFVLQQLQKDGISNFMNLILKSYSKYFNIKYNRKGPLWEGRFKNILIKTEEQFLHLTRYIHLNPVSGYLVNTPEDWLFSSYREYIGLVEENKKICDFSDYFNMEISSYKKFVTDRISYQRELEKIKYLILE